MMGLLIMDKGTLWVCAKPYIFPAVRSVLMKIPRAILALSIAFTGKAICGPLTPAGSGSYEYTFTGNTIAEFGATQLLSPGVYDYTGLPLPFDSGFGGRSLTLSSTGVWTFEARDLNFIEDWILIPTTSGVPGLGTTVYDSVVFEGFAYAQLVESSPVAGSANLEIALVPAAVPEPSTLIPMSTLVLVGIASRKRIAQGFRRATRTNA
jgi:hypothetical protein